ncbi:glycoside hydrolase family 26 protein [Mycolicibacterium sp. 120270]|uniref:glycoside hydrolase family 26 protein n=1 Tax=Mycolicibacterium sp. 120270 TaxID=3090600 RepID=UPI00299EBBE8|nr:glycosyl hydrolase [Mycolicibacterium sp. 120270]MDX1885594.1 glycosyl hydrolase [Mycolicibacterium sp. 120270]
MSLPSEQAPKMSRRGLLASIPLAALTMMAAGGCQKSEPSQPSQPRPARRFGLAATGLDGGSVQRSQAAAQQLGKHLDVLTVYEAFAWERSLPTQVLDAATAAGCVPELTWEPWDPRAGKHQAAYTAGQIAGGRYDAYVRAWAEQAAAYDKPFRLRFAHEMNGDWYPWAVGSPGGSPQDYVAAYRRIRGIFDDVGAEQVEWVWCPNVIVNGNADAVSSCFPGVDVVDIVGVDGYNFGDRPGHQWTEPAELFGSTLALVARLGQGKPVWINEVGCGDQGGDKVRWITDFISWLEGTDVAGLIWFEVDGKPDAPDWRLTSSESTTAAAKTALASW